MKPSLDLKSRLAQLTIVMGLGWTAIIGSLVVFNYILDITEAEKLAKVEALASYNKDLLYRKWVADHGGVYVPVTEGTPPNPYLAGVGERDIVTTSGMRLTLINPAYMTRQVFELENGQKSTKSRVTSLKPLQPQNSPDPWERASLVSFEKGAGEAVSVEEINGEKYLRLIRPFVTEERCLKCHSWQGYKVGDIRGGISVSVPMRPYLEIVRAEISHENEIYVVIWGCGIVLLFLTFFFASGRIEEKEAAEVRLRESEDKYRLISENTGDLIWVQDLDTERFTYVSPSSLRVVGYTPEEEMSMALDEVMTPESYRRFVGKMARRIVAIESGDPSSLIETNEADLKRKGGGIIHSEIVTTILLDPRGKPNAVLGVARDITERKKTNQELLETKAILQAAFDNSQVGIAMAEAPGGRIKYVNQAGQVILGKSEKELIGASSIDDYAATWGASGEDKKPLGYDGTPLAKALRNGERSSSEFTILRAGSEERWLLGNAAPIFDENMKVKAGVLVFMDITEKRIAEESMARLAAAVEQTADDVIIFSADGAIKYVNPACERTTGCSKGEVLGKNISFLYTDLKNTESFRLMKAELDAGRPWQGRFSSKTRGGRETIHSVSIAPIRDKLGAIIGCVATQRDITQQEEFEKRLAQSQKLEAMGVMAGGIAHDFNNILSAIIGYGELALEICDNPEVEEDVRLMLTASHRAVDLIKQILAFSRQSTREERPVMVKPVVKEAMKLLRASIPSTVRINTVAKTEAVVTGNPAEIHSIVVNLCTNASLAMREKGGTLTVSLDTVDLDMVYAKSHPGLAAGKYARLTVSDTGCGMSPEVKEHIFEPFFTTRKKGEGTGMGLATVHGIVRKMGGAISVESEEGRGTTFQIFLPVTSGVEVEETVFEDTPLPGGERILFVDDEEMVVDIARKSLGRLGYKVTVAMSGTEALEIFRKAPNGFDVVVTDMTMPAMTGDELAREIRFIRPEVPVILCTGYSDRINPKMASETGIREFLQKPVVLSQLTRVIRKALEKT